MLGVLIYLKLLLSMFTSQKNCLIVLALYPCYLSDARLDASSRRCLRRCSGAGSVADFI